MIVLLVLGGAQVYAELALVCGIVQAETALAPFIHASVPEGKPAAVVPAPQAESWWTTRHEHVLARIRQGNVGLLFIGDSITQGWASKGRSVWDEYYERRRAVNLGFAGDRTEHVLWRLDHGEIEGITPKLIVLMIGTNNSGHRHDPPAETAAGIEAILRTLLMGLPGTKILLLGIFPRGASGADHLRQLNAAINERIRHFADSQRVFFLDLSRRFLDEQEHASRELLPDYLHLSERGYQVWADGMETMIKTLLGE
ncbi:MAG: GDSL-type esterase/lipase family protein [Nitrospira sp.]|nr:GDSL-type esterase/lipase family protein [Nitrospira sp.]